MKNLKKVLAMVLAFACTFTMFASAKLYEDVPAGSDFSEAITMLSDLGIIQGKTDNKYHPEDTITRAEACALIARLMTGDPNAAGFNNAHHFKDVPAGFWASSAIGYCVVNGIAIGVDQAGTRFEPQRPIKDKEFVTMIVRALGYETPDMRNNFPFGYMSAANAIGLLQGVNMVPDTDALRGEDAQVIYNAMFVDYARGAKRVNVAHGTTVESYPTLAEDVWHLNRAALGTWNKKDDEDVTLSNCKAHNWVILGAAQDEENSLLALAIDDNEDTDLYKAEEKKHEYKAYKFKYEGTADIDALRGYKVELWGAGKHGEPVWEKDGDKFVYSNDWKIKAIKSVKGQTKFDYNASMADKKDHDGEIQIDEETKLKLESAADNAKLVKQEQGVKEVVTFAADELNTIKVKNDEALEQALNVRNGMQYRLMDWNGDKEIDWVVVDEARYYKVESATSKRVVVSSMEGDNLKSDKDSKVETWKIDDSEKIGKNLAGKDVKIKYEAPEGLKEGDIVEVTYKVTYEDKAQLITATVKVVDAENQKLEKVGTKDGLTLTFGDKELKVAQNARKDGGDVIVPANPQDYKGFNGEELGTEFALFKNRNGFIVYSDYATESSNYMMVLNTYGGKDTTGKRDLAVIDFVDTSNTEHKDVKVDSNVRIIDKDGNDLPVYNSNTRYFKETGVVGNVFKYWTDADGVITKMQAVFSADSKTKKYNTDTDYDYRADADRLVNGSNGYVSSLGDANVIFAVKSSDGDYIQRDHKGFGERVDGTDVIVKAEDVLAVKQSDIPDIYKSGTGNGDTEAKTLLKNNTLVSWLEGNTGASYVIENDKNSEATAAILGVDSFNKFNAGQTKLALVTNISENSSGVIEAEVAYDGKVETVASVEKQKFDNIVKVFDGKNDQDVGRADATITAPGNNIFHNNKLSDVVNEGGQYAEITTNADGKLTKVVFMDDDTSNDNLIRGHYYEVSRNLVLNVSDKNLRYGINDTNRAQYFAADDKLYTTGRLEASSAGYTNDAKFYTIDAKPSRHDKQYDSTRLTITAGFEDLDQRDIKPGERADIDFNEPNYTTDKNVYEVSDLAFNNKGDLVAVYSFKSLDEKSSKNVVKFANTGATKPSYDAGEKFTVIATMMDGTEVPANMGYAVFDEKGNNVSQFFTINQGTGEIEVLTSAPDGVYFVRLLDMNKLPMVGAYRFVVDNNTQTTPLNLSRVLFADENGSGMTDKAYINKDGHSFNIVVEPVTRATITAKLAKDNVVVFSGTTRLNVTSVVETEKANVYTVTVSDTLVPGSKLEVSIVAGGNIQVNGSTTGNLKLDEVKTETVPDAPVVIADGVKLVNSTGAPIDVVYPANEVYFKLTKGNTELTTKLDGVTILGEDGFVHSTVQVAGNESGIYKITNKTGSGKVEAGNYFVSLDGKKNDSLKVVVSDNTGFTFTVDGQDTTLNTAVSLATGTKELPIVKNGVKSVKLTDIGASLTGKVKFDNDTDPTKVIISGVDAPITTDNTFKVVASMADGSEDKTVDVTVTTEKHTFKTFTIAAGDDKTHIKLTVDDAAIAKKLAEELKTSIATKVTVKSGSQKDLSNAGTQRQCKSVNVSENTLTFEIDDISTDTFVGIKLTGLTAFADKDDLANAVQVAQAQTQPSITLGAENTTIDVLTADGDSKKKTTVTIENKKSGETVVVAQDDNALNTAGDNATVNGLKATWTEGNLTITGTPNKDGNAVFHLAVKKDGQIIPSSKKQFTVTVGKVTLTGEAALKVDDKTKIEITLKNGGANVQSADLNKLNLATDATGYTVTVAGKTVKNAAIEGDKLVITMNQALTTGGDVTAPLVIKETKFMNAVTINSVTG